MFLGYSFEGYSLSYHRLMAELNALPIESGLKNNIKIQNHLNDLDSLPLEDSDFLLWMMDSCFREHVC